MQLAKTNYQFFQKKAETFFNSLLKKYSRNIDNARDDGKHLVHSEFMRNVLKHYQDVRKDLGVNNSLLYEVNEECKKDGNKKINEVFEKKLMLTAEKNYPSLIKKLSSLNALDDFIIYLRSEGKKFTEERLKPEVNKPTIIWKGEIELEFVQLIYALNTAGYLNNEKNEITSLVKEVASAFNIKLGKNWQSNLSKSVNNRKQNYIPEIFLKLQTAFEDYRVRQINKSR